MARWKVSAKIQQLLNTLKKPKKRHLEEFYEDDDIELEMAANPKDPNAPKKPLSAYFLFSQDERLKVKAEFPDYSITEVAKELGRRWATIDPAIKQSYEQRYQESRRQYEQALQVILNSYLSLYLNLI